MRKSGYLISLFALVTLAVTGCGGHFNSNSHSSAVNPTLVSIRVTAATDSVVAGSTLQFSATGTYSDNSTSSLTSQVTWQSLDKTIATVSNSGLATGVKAGLVTIKATLGSVSGSMSLTVNPAALTSITVSGASSSLIAGASEQLTAQGTYADNSTADITAQVTWQSLDSTTATVSASGLATGVKAGLVTVKAILGSVSGTMALTVNPPTLTAIEVVPSSFSVASGQVLQLSAQGVYSNGTIQDVTTQASWSSGNSSSISVSNTGQALGVAPGSATITAAVGSVSGTASGTTTALVLSSISVTPSSASIATGETQAFTATGIFSDGSSTDMTKSVTWSSDNESFATVNSAGVATGLSNSNGSTVTITATSGTLAGSAALTVTSAVLTDLNISPSNQSMPVGGQIPLTLTGTFSDGSTQSITNAAWSSSDPTLATVDPTTGVVTGVANSNGSPVTISATAGLTATTSVYVTSATIASITLSPATATIASGTTQQYSVYANFSDESTQLLSEGLSWSSSSPSTAAVSASGLALGLAPGQSTITVSYGTLTTSAALVVTPATLTSITVNPPLPSVNVNGSVQFTATGTFSDTSTQDISALVTWSSSAASVASVSGNGLAIALGPGSSMIAASLDGVTGSTTLTVNAPTLTSITVSGGSSLNAGMSEQLTAEGTYSDSSTAPLPSQEVTWQSDNTSSAIVSASGIVTGLAAGTANITATVGAVVSTPLALTINPPTLTSIVITPGIFSVAAGQTYQLSALGIYSNGASQDVTAQATWSSNSGSLTVAGGLATGVSAGSATITAAIGSVSGSASGTTTAAVLNSITVTPSTASIAIGQTQAFTATGVFSDSSSTDMTKSVTWSSGNTNWATINSSGVATGVGNSGSSAVTITAAAGAVSGTASLTVTSAVLSGINISPDDQTIPVGGQFQLTLNGSYSDGSEAAIPSATWSSSNTALATVDPVTGLVTGVADSNGNPVTITASFGGFTDTTSIYITSAVAVSLQLTPATASIASGTTQQYAVSAIYSDGSNQPLSEGLTWNSSTPSVAGINASGLATGITSGQTAINVYYGSMSASALLYVTPATLTSIVVVPSLPEVGVKGTLQFTAMGVFSDKSTQDLTTQATWSSSASGVASVSSTGLATGLTLGTSTITASYEGVSGSATLNVTNIQLVSIAITPANPVLPAHASLQMTAVGTYSDGSTAPLSGVSWSISCSGSNGWWQWFTASISRSGVVSTRWSTNRTCTIYAKLSGITGQTTLTISSMTIASLTITPADPTIAVGTTQAFKLLGTYSDGVTTVDLTMSAYWQSSNYREAYINRSGVASANRTGSVTISAYYRGLTPATTTLTVTNATLQSIEVNPQTATVVLGSPQAFTATGNFSDGSSQDITAVSRWTSSDPTVAVVKQNGIAYSASHGQTNITAQYKGASNSAVLSVN